MKQNIVLIGMMGCGKTTCAGLLAEQLGWKAVDTDHMIEQALGRTIADIFAREGEPFFRDWELGVSEELARETHLVIACGGGLPTRPDSIASLKYSGTVIWLRRDPGESYDTMEISCRPLARQGREDFLARFARREPIYREWAEHIIEEFSSPEATVQAILEVLK